MALAAVSLTVGAAGHEPPTATTPGELMAGFSWNTRPLLLFSPASERDAAALLRRQWRASETDWRDRNMALVETIGADEVHINGQPSGLNADAMRRFFAVKPEQFVIMLVGYDGEVKLRRGGTDVLREVYALIDTMPIRQTEMLNGN